MAAGPARVASSWQAIGWRQVGSAARRQAARPDGRQAARPDVGYVGYVVIVF